MNSQLNLPMSRLGGIVRSAATLLLTCTAFLLNHAAWAEPLKPKHHHHPVLPEVNAGLVLIPIAIGIMLWSSLRLFRGRAAQQQ